MECDVYGYCGGREGFVSRCGNNGCGLCDSLCLIANIANLCRRCYAMSTLTVLAQYYDTILPK